ncbi:MAG TPA: MXAN_6640 family putative metalloprotease [Nocardioidaceae bacterium]|nr:MXAN_6640 family putative metalloprotease [Nocardioidaceae bacterium]
MRFKHIAAVLGSCALIISTPAYALPDQAATPTRPAQAEAAAQVALERVQELLASKETPGRAKAAQVVGHADATMALRDLYFARTALKGSDRAAADRILARPTEGASDPAGDGYSGGVQQSTCGTNVCIHWVMGDTKGDAPEPDDFGPTVPNGLPDQVDTTLATAEYVWQKTVTEGKYLAPLSDVLSSPNGGDAKLDIYLANLTDQGLYGYCTSDDPNADNDLKVSAYCVIDDDFEGYPLDPLPSLQVTVAHEFFHAVQFAYEAAEDAWFMESTAAWIEDELYDSVNDNMNYIAPGAQGNPISSPWVPLDLWQNNWRSYGDWVFWKKLSETYPNKAGTSLPNIVREVWTAAGNPNPGGASTMALSKVLAAHNTSFGKFFTKWGVGNRFPKKSYSEGRANKYPTAPLGGRFFLSKDKRHLGWKGVKLNHMTNIHARITPKSSLTGKGWKLRVTVNTPDKVRGSFATLIVYKKTGKIVTVPVKLNRSGDGVGTVPFGRGSVKFIELTMTNASNRFKNCYPFTNPSNFTCSGTPRDDKLVFTFKAAVVR